MRRGAIVTAIGVLVLSLGKRRGDASAFQAIRGMVPVDRGRRPQSSRHEAGLGDSRRR